MNFNEPVVFCEKQCAATNYPEELIPDFLWAAAPRDLFNVHISDVLKYQWDEVTDPETIAETIREWRPFIIVGADFYAGKKLSH